MILDFQILKARYNKEGSGASILVLTVDAPERVVYTADTRQLPQGGRSQAAQLEELAKELKKMLPTAHPRYAILDFDGPRRRELEFLTWSPFAAPAHEKMNYTSQIGTVQKAGGKDFTSFRGLKDVKARRNCAEHQMQRKRRCCKATVVRTPWKLIVAQCSAIPRQVVSHAEVRRALGIHGHAAATKPRVGAGGGGGGGGGTANSSSSKKKKSDDDGLVRGTNVRGGGDSSSDEEEEEWDF